MKVGFIGLGNAGGKLAGSLWTMIPDAPTEWWPDAHFRMATQLRLGALSLPPATTCCRTRKDGGDPCGRPLDVTHLLQCK